MNYQEEKEQLELQNETRVRKISELESNINSMKEAITKLGAEINFARGQIALLDKLIKENK